MVRVGPGDDDIHLTSPGKKGFADRSASRTQSATGSSRRRVEPTVLLEVLLGSDDELDGDKLVAVVQSVQSKVVSTGILTHGSRNER